MKIIGISGEIGAGKDTTADFLVANHGFTKVSIGEYIRRELTCAEWLVKGDKAIPASVRGLLNSMGRDKRRAILYAKPTNPIAREALQWFGEMWVIQDQNHWIAPLVSDIRDRQLERVVWCDVRSPLEYQMVKMMGGDMWKVIRNIVKRKVADIKASKHITETALQGYKFDVELNNNGSLSLLSERVDRLIGLPLHADKGPFGSGQEHPIDIG